MVIVLILAGVAAILATVPFLLPWPQRVRWLLASVATPDPTGMSAASDALMMREVTVGDVHRSAERLTVELSEASQDGGSSPSVLPASGDTAAATARLDRWSAANTPLLLVQRAGEASLYGPSHAAVGLRPSAHGADGAARLGTARLLHPSRGPVPRQARIIVAR